MLFENDVCVIKKLFYWTISKKIIKSKIKNQKSPGRGNCALLHVVEPERTLAVALLCQGPPVGGDQHGLYLLPLARLHPLEIAEVKDVLDLLPMGKVRGPRDENTAEVPY